MSVSILCSPEQIGSFKRPALIVGHPGHELTVFGWMSMKQPRVYVLSDGSGHVGEPRAASSAMLLRSRGAVPDAIFGEYSDARFYRAFLDQDCGFFIGILDGLARSLEAQRIDFVVADALEGYNPTHDICRVLTNAAVAIAGRTTERAIANYEFSLTEWVSGFPQKHGPECLHLSLSEELFQEKFMAAESYSELGGETQDALRRLGAEHFRTECLRKVLGQAHGAELTGKPYYETWGERRKSQGLYQEVIRYRQHVAPIIKAIDEYVSDVV